MITEEITRLSLPTFALIKDLQLVDAEDDPRINGGQIIETATQPEVLLTKIPNPSFPADAARRKMLAKRFWAMSADDFQAEVNAGEMGFNSYPLAVADSPGDHEIFGESYSVAWLCGDDILASAKQMMAAVTPAARKEGSLEDGIVYIYSEFIDRMIYVGKPETYNQDSYFTMLTSHFEEMLQDKFGRKINWPKLNGLLGRG